MQRYVLDVEPRVKLGKGASRQLRRQGFIPCVVYKDGYSLPIQAQAKKLVQFMNIAVREKIFVTLKLPNEEKQAILKDYQVDPVSGQLLHVDFMEVSATEKIRVTVPVILVGEAVGIKQGGVLQHGISEIEIEAIPEKIPGHIEVDVSKLEIGQSIHIRDIKFEEGIKVLSDPDEVIATVTVEAEEAEVAPSTEEVVEPEVIKKGKKAKEEESEQ